METSLTVSVWALSVWAVHVSFCLVSWTWPVFNRSCVEQENTVVLHQTGPVFAALRETINYSLSLSSSRTLVALPIDMGVTRWDRVMVT